MKRKKRLFSGRNQKRAVKQRRYHFCLKFTLICLLSVFIGFFGDRLLKQSSSFPLKDIQVQGVLNKIDVQGVQQASGLQWGENLFQIRLDQVRKNFLKISEISSVCVRRQLPSTIIIEIEEHEPHFILYSKNEYFYVDEKGKVYKNITETRDSRDFPFLTGLSLEHLDVSQREKIILLALRLKHQYGKQGLEAVLPISELHFEKNNGFTLYPEKKKYSIKVGRDQFESKFKKLFLSVDQLSDPKGNISLVDLNYSGKILVRL